MCKVQLIQLPLHPSTAWEPTGNIPLASAILAAAAKLPPESIFPEDLLNRAGDAALETALRKRNPELIGVTLYLWNRERTLHLIHRLKSWNPKLLVVAGGPEVTPDNYTLLNESAIDLFVAGEGEVFAADVLSPDKLRVILETGQKVLGPALCTYPPDKWPDPYETGYLTTPAGGSVHIETQRGCQCRCSYCAYRRTSPVPRIVPADKVLKKIRMHLEMGAEEFVFLDPTFNSRTDLSALLKGMAKDEFDCFAEVRGDLVASENTANELAAAGFSSLEVGLQTMSKEILHAVGRGGDPFSILRGASLLKESGIIPVIDLILGLPGDDPENIVRAAKEIVSRDLGDQVQTFCLSVLPGTELRTNSQKLGIRYRDFPPYSITSSGEYTIDDLLDTRDKVADILGYDPDPPPRPVLCDSFPGMEIFIPEKNQSKNSPSVRHGVLRVKTSDAWLHRGKILRKVNERRKLDPYCPLDLVLESKSLFPLDLIEQLLDIDSPDCYITEKAEIYNVPGFIRIAVIGEQETDRGWLNEAATLTTTVIESSTPVSLPGGQVGLLLKGNYDLSELNALYSEAPHLVFFARRELELLWNLEIIGLG